MQTRQNVTEACARSKVGGEAHEDSGGREDASSHDGLGFSLYGFTDTSIVELVQGCYKTDVASGRARGGFGRDAITNILVRRGGLVLGSDAISASSAGDLLEVRYGDRYICCAVEFPG